MNRVSVPPPRSTIPARPTRRTRQMRMPLSKRRGSATAQQTQFTREQSKAQRIDVNGRGYRWVADRPVVVICVDGCEHRYITVAVEAGVAPFLARVLETGTALSAPLPNPVLVPSDTSIFEVLQRPLESAQR